MLKLVKPHHYSKKEKSASKRNKFMSSFRVRDKKTWEWLKKGRLKKETEGTIIAAQDQALRTNSIKRIIDKQNVSAKCIIGGEGDKTVRHIVSECKKLAQKQS